MRSFRVILFILFNICVIESANRNESDEDPVIKFKSDFSENVSEEKVQGKSGGKYYETYEFVDEGNADNFVAKKNGEEDRFGKESQGSKETFPREVFLSLRNLSGTVATPFRGFTHTNDITDLQASATDNVNVTDNDTNHVPLESSGINLRALRDAGYPPIRIAENEVYPVSKILTDFSPGQILHIGYLFDNLKKKKPPLLFKMAIEENISDLLGHFKKKSI